MANRKRTVAEPTDAIAALREISQKPAEPDPIVQAAIDNFAEKGDALPLATQMDLSNVGNTLARMDNEAAADPAFEKIYEDARKKSTGYLVQRRVSGNRNAMVPPNCEIHPRLGMWGLRYGGRWMIIRWLDIRPTTRQKRIAQGWQYFEGKIWCERLGLLPESYLNDRGRIGYMDVELGWAPEEYIFMRGEQAEEAKKAMIASAQDRLYAAQSKHVPRIEIMQGDEQSVLGELYDRKRFAEGHS